MLTANSKKPFGRPAVCSMAIALSIMVRLNRSAFPFCEAQTKSQLCRLKHLTFKVRCLSLHSCDFVCASQNGKAERFNRTIMDKAMAMLHTAGLPNGFLEFAVSMAVHIYN